MIYVSSVRYFEDDGPALLISDENGSYRWSEDGKTFIDNAILDHIAKQDRYKKAGAKEKHEWLQRGFRNIAVISNAKRMDITPEEALLGQK